VRRRGGCSRAREDAERGRRKRGANCWIRGRGKRWVMRRMRRMRRRKGRGRMGRGYTPFFPLLPLLHLLRRGEVCARGAAAAE
jgi:hypothetical protein